MYEVVLLAIDLDHSSSWTKALPTALNMCRTYGARLHLVNVVPDFSSNVVGANFPTGTKERMLEKAARRLDSLIEETVPNDVPAECQVRVGTVYREVLAAASETAADLIVMASHRPSDKDYPLGSNAACVVRHAACSVMVVRDDPSSC